MKIVVFATDNKDIDLDKTNRAGLKQIGVETELSRIAWQSRQKSADVEGAIYTIHLPSFQYVAGNAEFDELLTLAVDGMLSRQDWDGPEHQAVWWVE